MINAPVNTPPMLHLPEMGEGERLSRALLGGPGSRGTHPSVHPWSRTGPRIPGTMGLPESTPQMSSGKGNLGAPSWTSAVRSL